MDARENEERPGTREDADDLRVRRLGHGPEDGPHEIARFPVIEEEALVEKRVVTTGTVRVVRRVETVEEDVEVALATEHAVFERVAIGRFVDEAPEVRREGDVWIVPVTEEVLVVEKRLWLAEELHVWTRRDERIERRLVPLRRQRVDVAGTEAGSGRTDDADAAATHRRQTPGQGTEKEQ